MIEFPYLLPFQSTLQHILYTAASSGTTSGSSHVTALLIPQPFRHFTYVTTHSPTLPSLYLCHSSFSNPSVATPTSQFILQPFFLFPQGTSSSLNSPAEPPMVQTRPGVDGFFSERKNPEYDFHRKPWVLCRRFTASTRTSNRN